MKNAERETYNTGQQGQSFNGEERPRQIHVDHFDLGKGNRIIFHGKSFEAKTGKVIKGTGRRGRDRGKK